MILARSAPEAPPPELSLDALITEHGDAVLRLAVAMLRDRALAEDVFQDVFVRALRAGATVRDPEAIRSWLLTITANRCRDELRSWTRRNVSFVAEVPEPAAAAEFSLDDPADPELARAVLDLPLPLRAAILLHYYYELPVAAAAKVLGVSPVTVRTRLHRGRAALRRALKKEVAHHA